MDLAPRSSSAPRGDFFVNDLSSPWEQRPRRSVSAETGLFADRKEARLAPRLDPFGRGVLQYIPMAVVGYKRRAIAYGSPMKRAARDLGTA